MSDLETIKALLDKVGTKYKFMVADHISKGYNLELWVNGDWADASFYFKDSELVRFSCYS